METFDSIEGADEAERAENVARSGLDRIRILTAISTSDGERRQPGRQELIRSLTDQHVAVLVVGADALDGTAFRT